MSMDRPPRPRRPRSLLVTIATAMILAIGAVAAAGAGAASSIEGIWSFNGGQIAIQPSSGGTFTGTVVAETKFAECTHPVGQPIWTGIALQPDGSYWGLHQWYFEKSSCAPNPTPGPTAWRVLAGANGSRYLRVCLSSPGTSQPTIAANGSGSGATYGCVNSGLTSPLPASGRARSKEKLSLPSAKKCLSHRVFQIHLLDPRYDPLEKVTVTIRGRRIATARRGRYVVATINLRGLPRGAFTVKIRATTILGHHLSVSRAYHTCAKPVKHSRKSRRR